MTSDKIAALLRSKRFRFSSEKELQDALESVFVAEGILFQRECRLSPTDQIDFLIDGGLGLEVKIQEGLTAVTRQLHRYAEHDRVTSLVLVTTRMVHRGLPSEMLGKAVSVVCLPPF